MKTRKSGDKGERAEFKPTVSKIHLLIALTVGLFSPVSPAQQYSQQRSSYSNNLDPSEEQTGIMDPYDEAVYSRNYRFIKVAATSSIALRGQISEQDVRHLFASFQDRSRYKTLFGGEWNVSPVRMVRFSLDQFHQYFPNWKVKVPLAVYMREDKTIYVSDELNLSNLAHQSILGHEYVHHLQLEEGFIGNDCASWEANEKEAASVQRAWGDKYLRVHAVDIRAAHVNPCGNPIIEVRNQ